LPEKEPQATLDVLRLLANNKQIASFQVLSESLDVYNNAIKTLDYHQSIEALLEILDDCLEGYAIFPGSYGRRELLDWWLLEVVPASWYLLAPTSIYLVDKLANEKSMALHQLDKLEKISSAMWSIILMKLQSKDSLHTLSFSNMFDFDLEQIKLDSKIVNIQFVSNKI
jgi:hypothetical protein